MSTEITINGWLILFLCVMYSTGAVFVSYILSETFKEKSDTAFGWLLLLGSYLWPIGLIVYVIYGVGVIIKDFCGSDTVTTK